MVHNCNIDTEEAKTEGSCLQQCVAKQPTGQLPNQIKEQDLVFWESKQWMLTSEGIPFMNNDAESGEVPSAENLRVSIGLIDQGHY